jgi:hypothetical protein
MTDIGNNTAYRAAITQGNDQLKPESADMFNVGFSWIPEGRLEGLQVDIDYYNYDYEDIIGRENFKDILDADIKELQAAINDGQSLVEAVDAGVGNRSQVVRNGAGIVVRVLPNFLNLSSAEISGIDFQNSYAFETKVGEFRLGLQGNYGLKYEIATGDSIYDGLGFYNETNPVAPRRPHPELKMNASLHWRRAEHSAFFVLRYTDGYEKKTLTPTDGFWRATVGRALGAEAAANFYDTSIDSWTTADIQYTYRFDDLAFADTTSFTIGAKNLTNEEPPWVPYITSYDPVNHDARGRIWYLRLSASL